jgi:hypothetical protein
MMKTPLPLATCALATSLLTTGAHTQNPPQTPPAPGQTLPTAPGQRTTVVPTGLSASGGSIVNGVYTNSIYGFSLHIPAGWAVIPPQTAKIPQAGSSQPESEKQRMQVVLIMTENAPLKKSTQRKGLQIVSMQLAAAADSSAADGYIAYSQRMAKEKGMEIEYKGSPEKVTINDQQFTKVNLEETTEGAVQHIEQYVTTRGRALLQFFLITPDTSGLPTLEPIIQSLQFKMPAAKKPGPKKPAKPQK